MQKSGGNSLRRSKNRCYLSLAYSLGSLGLACGSLWFTNSSADRVSLQRGIFLTSLGFVHFVSLTDFFDKYLLETAHGCQLRKKYRLVVSDAMDITNKLVSAIQAVYSFLVGLIVCKSTCSKSFVYASHILMEAYGWFGTAYFMYDIWTMYKGHMQKLADKLRLKRPAALKTNGYANELGNGNALYDKQTFSAGRQNGVAKHECSFEDDILDTNADNVTCTTGKLDFLKYVINHPVMVMHHIFIGTFGLLVVTYIRGGGHCIYSYMFMMEFSTPFVSLRGILSILGMKEARIYIVNGLTMILVFFVVRVCVWPYVMWRYSQAINVSLWQAILGLPKGCIISISILFIPQLYWFFLMVKGAIKVLLPAKNKKKLMAAKSHSNSNNRSTVHVNGAESSELNGHLGKPNRQLKAAAVKKTI